MVETFDIKPVVSLKDISKNFGATQALKKINFNVFPGEIHSLVGINGAGKSTLVKILQGIHIPDSGEILINGEPALITSPTDAQKYGISMVFQELNLFANLTIAENLMMGVDFPKKNGLIRWKDTYNKVDSVLKSFNINISPKEKIKSISPANQQLIEIIKSIMGKPCILMLDEPSSSLSEKEEKKLYELVNMLRSEGNALLFISHKMEEIMDLSDRITVLRDGEIVSEGLASEYTIDKITEAMLGKSVDIYKSHKTTGKQDKRKECALYVENLSLEKKFDDVSFSIDEGEVVAITGLVGSGKSDVGRALFGVYKNVMGNAYVGGKKYTCRSPNAAVQAGVGFLPSSRKEEGILENFSIRKNITITILDLLGFFIKFTKEREITHTYIDLFSISPKDTETFITSLSGGNQQKVVLARWFAKDLKVLILDEPTRGVDVGAKQDIYEILKRIAEKTNTAILVITSEIEEALAISDRILVMRMGRIVESKDTELLSRNKILKLAMAGGKSEN